MGGDFKWSFDGGWGVVTREDGGERVGFILGVLERESRERVEREEKRERGGKKERGVGFTPKGHSIDTFKDQMIFSFSLFQNGGGALLFIVEYKYIRPFYPHTNVIKTSVVLKGLIKTQNTK